MKRILALAIIFACFISCTNSRKNSDTIFRQLHAKTTGIDFINTLTENDSLNYFTYSYLYMGGGISAGDINNDGLTDLFFTGNMVDNKLYLNKGGLKFEDITETAGVSGDSRWYTGTTMADVNNDGFLDIYCSVGGKFGPKENQLFINNGDNTFTEKAKEYGIDDTANSVQATFFDYDRDGDLDMYLANYPPTPFNVPNSYYRIKKALPKPKETDRLYRNDNGTFKDVAKEAGIVNFGLSLSATVGDVNADGWPDLYVSNDFSTPDYLFVNNQDGTFTEEVKNVTKNTSFYGMGVDIADFNNDSFLDIIQVDMSAEDNRRSKANMASMDPILFWSTVNSGFHYQYMQNSLQVSNGMINGDSLPDFSNISRLAGVSSTDWSWGPLFVDLDNDGWKDIFISNGSRREINNRDYFSKIEKRNGPLDSTLQRSLAIPSERVDNYALKNNRDLTFTKMNDAWGISFEGFSNGSVYVDLDNDGDLEIITNNIDDKASIFENKSSEKNNHVTLKFKGPKQNPFGLGVKAVVNQENFSQFQEMTLTRGFQSSVAPQLHFGLGKATSIEEVKITWPDGKEQVFNNLSANQLLEVSYADAVEASSEIEENINAKLFATVTDSTLLPVHRHIENIFNDFSTEILLPHQTSMFGPGIAVGDLNGDDLDDFVVGGASFRRAGVFLQGETGFVKHHIPAVANDSIAEDLGGLVFDADMDGDNDLYMVSGGNEFTPTSPYLQDRLYVNDGQGNFQRSATALPTMITSGSRVHPFDYDKDGDLDLFVGGRLVPQNYPSPANSYILENISTPGNPKFRNVSDNIAPFLKEFGLVTDASWTDYDNDGWTDLVLVGEWMPITILKNVNGVFENTTAQMGLENTTGWWFSLEQGDFDKDGDIDFIAGNLGLNYKYKANEKETFDIYLNDFDNNKKKDIVLSYFNGGKKFPLRGRECSSQQIPGIKRKFENYASFSTATLEDVYTEASLENSLHYQVKSFESVYLENNNGVFEIHALPNLAQVSSINQIVIDDFNKDSHLDVLIAGNLHNSEVETPRNDASTGLFLKGDSTGNFEVVRAHESGFFAKGDVKDMAPIVIKGEPYMLIAKNSDFLQLVRILPGTAKNSSIAQLQPK